MDIISSRMKKRIDSHLKYNPGLSNYQHNNRSSNKYEVLEQTISLSDESLKFYNIHLFPLLRRSLRNYNILNMIKISHLHKFPKNA